MGSGLPLEDLLCVPRDFAVKMELKRYNRKPQRNAEKRRVDALVYGRWKTPSNHTVFGTVTPLHGV